MTIIAQTVEGKKIVQTVVTGPASYATGGFTVRLGELNVIHAVKVSVQTNLKVSNYVHAVDYSYTGNAITVVVYRIDVTATSPSAWSEVASATDISALKLEIIAIGV
jgi:hypothetical protein